MKLDEFIGVVKEFEPEFDITELQKQRYRNFCMGNIVDTEKLQIKAFTQDGRIGIMRIYGSKLPKNLKDVTWQLLAEEIADNHSNNGVEVSLRDAHYLGKEGPWVYEARARAVSYTKDNLKSTLTELTSTTDETIGIINAEMGRLRSLKKSEKTRI